MTFQFLLKIFGLYAGIIKSRSLYDFFGLVYDLFGFSVMGGFTMDVIASAGYGLELDSQNDPNNPFVINARKIIDGLDMKIFLPVSKLQLINPL